MLLNVGNWIVDTRRHCEEACPERSRMGGNLKKFTTNGREEMVNRQS